ncbi:O-acyltransferase WSD1-like [Heracleum sosnowskyi]|uniref:O-acyltransferase WSD1-like n=1 Tax=Heracleum sosnowskyi TaxID=360622 RepID=A0AAD8HLK7_9APIA|nr:O-acyltransferase WSD1-like [Heracleum sosnowskyi]
MEFDEEILEPVSPTGHYLNSSVLSLTILGVLETEIPIDDSQTLPLLRDVFLPINPRFSSIMVGEKNGVKKWKKVEVNLTDHVKVPILPDGMSLGYYDDSLSNYLSKLGMDLLPQTRPLWEVHIFKYPTSDAAGTVIFKLHHALGDGYSLIGALLSCLKRMDNPSIPLTFPSRQTNSSLKSPKDNGVSSIFKRVIGIPSSLANTVWDFGSSLLKSSIIVDVESPIRSGRDGVEFQPMAIRTMELSLEQIKSIKSNLKVTLNDVIAGVILLGSRLYMGGESKESTNFDTNALVLFNTRNVDGYKSVDEMLKPKSTMPWDPLKFVYETRNTVKRRRNSAGVFLTSVMLDYLTKFRGPEVTSKYIRNTLINSSITITNLIGPVEQMSLSDHPVKGLYFIVVNSPQSAEVTVMSYMGKLRLGIGVEKDFINPHKFKSCIANALDMISEAAAAVS